jgi:hypothetical protein
VGDRFRRPHWKLAARPGGAVDAREPLYVVELGAGTGIFSHAFVTAIARAAPAGTFPHPRVVLILCDQSEMRFDEWAEPTFSRRTLVPVHRFRNAERE